MTYLIYSLETGDVLRSVTCTADQVGGQTAPGEGLLQADVKLPLTSYCVIDNELQLKPPRPSASHTWHHGWRDLRSLDDVKHDAWEHVKALRAAAVDRPFSFNNHLFDGGGIQLAAAAASAAVATNTAFSVDWTTADNQVVTLDASQVLQLAIAHNQHVQRAHDAARQLREQIATADSAAAVATILERSAL